MGGGLRGIFPIVNLLASNCSNSSGVNSLLGVCNLSDVIMLGTAEGTDVTLCPEAPPAVCAAEVLLAPEWKVPVTALAVPVSGAVLEELEGGAAAAEAELPKPENPEVPPPLVVPEVLKEKEAADGAELLPNPTGWGTLGEDVTPKAGGLETAAELPKGEVFPDGTPEFVLKEKVEASLLLFTGKLGNPKLEACCPPNPREGNG